MEIPALLMQLLRYDEFGGGTTSRLHHQLESFSISVSIYFKLILLIVTLHFKLSSFENIFFLQSWFIEELLDETDYI